jgi:hypothetical protein
MWERGGGAHGAGGASGSRWRERQFRVEKGGGKGSVVGGPAQQAGRSKGLRQRPLGRKAEQAGRAVGPTGPELKRTSF